MPEPIEITLGTPLEITLLGKTPIYLSLDEQGATEAPIELHLLAEAPVNL